MNRREFIKHTLSLALFLGTYRFRNLKALAASSQRILLNIVLEGGPDFRHLIVPPYNLSTSSYGYQYWAHRYQAHSIGSSASDWQTRWNDDYLPVTSGETTFGILSKAQWLKDQFDAGKVAIINNVVGSSTRDHSQATLALEAGDASTGPHDFGRDGWGGRLSAFLEANVVSMTRQVLLFCNGPHASDSRLHDNSRVISAKDSRNMALYVPNSLDLDPAATDKLAVMSRALTNYYAAKKNELSVDSPFYKFSQHEQNFREFGQLINARLDANPLPTTIESLYEGDDALNSAYFGQQIRNVYDSLLCSDILNFRIGSLEYGGWDSHKNQVSQIEPNLEDLFGASGGLDTLYSSLSASVAENLVIVISGEFGRQLSANGDGGTDHGRGNTMLIIGNPVAGGLYGTLFSESEMGRFDEPSSDIEGLTSMEHVFGAVCDWMQAGAGSAVFPNQASADLEEGINLEGLFV